MKKNWKSGRPVKRGHLFNNVIITPRYGVTCVTCVTCYGPLRRLQRLLRIVDGGRGRGQGRGKGKGGQGVVAKKSVTQDHNANSACCRTDASPKTTSQIDVKQAKLLPD